MPVDFTLPPDVEEVRLRVRKFMDSNVRPEEKRLESNGADRGEYVRTIVGLREKAKGEGLWNPHLPPEWDGMGLGPTAMAFVSAEAGEIVRDIDTMAGRGNHCEIRISDLHVADDKMLGGRGEGHLLGQYRLGPARLAHCMRWIGNAEVALEMLMDRALKRFAHGSMLADKQGIQWMMSESAMELYAAKLMVLHAAYKIENK